MNAGDDPFILGKNAVMTRKDVRDLNLMSDDKFDLRPVDLARWGRWNEWIHHLESLDREI